MGAAKGNNYAKGNKGGNGAPKENSYALGNKGGTGQPTKYKPEFNKMVKEMAMLGLIDREMYAVLGVSQPTFDGWKKKHPKFKEALVKGRIKADMKVVKSLFERATGYKHKEDKIFLHEGIPVIVPTIKRYAPCPVSIKTWLHNRQPDKWRERREEERETPDQVVKIVFGDLDKI